MSFVFILCWSVLGVACNDRSETTLAWLLTINQIPLPMGCNGGIVYSCSLKPALPLFGHVMETSKNSPPSKCKQRAAQGRTDFAFFGLVPSAASDRDSKWLQVSLFDLCIRACFIQPHKLNVTHVNCASNFPSHGKWLSPRVRVLKETFTASGGLPNAVGMLATKLCLCLEAEQCTIAAIFCACRITDVFICKIFVLLQKTFSPLFLCVGCIKSFLSLSVSIHELMIE